MNTFEIVKTSFDEVYGSLPIPVVLLDKKAKLIKVNLSFLNLTNNGWNDYQTHSIVPLFKDFKTYDEGEWSLRNLPDQYISEIKDVNGKYIPVSIIYQNLNEDDGLFGGGLGFISDLREKNASNETIKKMTIENEALKDQLAGKVPESIMQERKRLEHDLKEANEFLEDVVESCGDGIIIIDNKGKITRVNESFADMVGKEKEELKGVFIYELGPREGTFKSTTGESITLDQEYYDDMASKVVQNSQLKTGEKIENWEVYFFNKNKDLMPLDVTVTKTRSSEGIYTGSVLSTRDLTRKKIAEKEIREAKDFLENIFKTTADGIIVADIRGNIVRVNKAAENITGYQEDELIGKHPGELAPQGAEYMKASHDMIEQLYDKGYVENWEHLWCRKDGSLCPAENNIVLLKDRKGEVLGSVRAIRDITERKKSEEALRMSEERYSKLIEYAKDAIISTDEEGKIITINQKAEDLYGYSREELVGESALLIMTPSERKKQKEYLENFIKTKEFRTFGKPVEEKHVNKDGKEFPVEASIFGLVLHGKQTFTAFVRDISERKQAEKTLKKAHDELEKKVEERTADLKIANEQLRQEITGHKYTEGELRETRDHLDNIIRSSLDAIVVTDHAGYITRTSNSFLQLLA